MKGATLIIAVDGAVGRLDAAKNPGADVTIDYTKTDPLTEIMRLTKGRGVDVAIEAVGCNNHLKLACARSSQVGRYRAVGCIPES